MIGLAPRETGTIESAPPAYFGGNFDNWRLGAGATVYPSDSAPGALLSVGDPHAAQGDGDVGGPADGSVAIADGLSKPGDYGELIAERPVVAMLSNCPQENKSCSGWGPTPIEVSVTRAS